MLRAEGLDKSFGALHVARDVSLHLAPGVRHALIGPNGAGKTTLFDLLCGMVAADAGRVWLDGADVTAASADQRARAGLARSFQRNNLFADMTVAANLATAIVLAQGHGPVFWKGLRRLSGVAAAVAEIAALVGVDGVMNQPADTLAYGMQRQLEIGLALALAPKVLLLDEPTSGMSPDETAAMQRLIGGLPPTMAVLVIEHDMDVVFDFADRITVLDYGTVLFEGTPGEVRQSEAVRRRYLGAEA
ncbi:MAG: ABC transporter ATP-binding protein [Alphaproteobacteria bacterium]|nr:ABC transporter ATP-binding protein [Alphaproteobacteria bacterium]